MAVVLAACSGSSIDARMEDARTAAKRGDLKAAQIQLRSILQEKPEHLEARYMLGTALFAAGDLIPAEIELRKAYEGRYDEALVIPLLARLMVERQEFRRLFEEFGKVELTKPEAQVELETTLALAHARQGRIAEAERLVERALVENPKYAAARVLQARLAAVGGRLDRARELIKATLVDEPRNVEALLLQADLTLVGGSTGPAIEAYRRVIEVSPSHLGAHAAITMLLLSERTLPEAKKQFELMRKAAPRHPQTLLFAAQFALLAGDVKAAREATQRLLNVAPEDIKVLQLAGMTEMRLGAYRAAESHLGKALALAPSAHAVRALLAQNYLQAGDIAKATTAIAPLVDSRDANPRVLGLAGEIALHSGDVRGAETLFDRAARAQPQNVQPRMALALIQIGRGNVDSGYRELEALSASLGNDLSADLALVAAKARRHDYKGALAAVDAIERKVPDTFQAPLLRARIAMMQRDLPTARRQFEAALARRPELRTAVEGLASVDLLERKPDQASARFEALLKDNPKDAAAHRAIAQILIEQGAARDKVVSRLRTAIAAGPNEAVSRNLLVTYLLRSGDSRGAVEVAQEAVAALPDDPSLQAALGRAALAQGETDRALRAFGQAAQLSPGRPEPHLLIGQVHLRAGNEAEARNSYRRALAIDPHLLEAQQALAMLLATRRQTSEAIALAKDVQARRPDEAVGFLLEGDIRSLEKNWTAAIAAYAIGLRKADPGKTPERLHLALVRAGRMAEADRHADEWLRTTPDDGDFHQHLGEFALSRGDYASARKHFTRAVELRPRNVVALNNLAWIAFKEGRPDALALAESAARQAPSNLAVLDTLAQVLSAQKSHDRASGVARKVLDLTPKNPVYRINAAEVLLAAGDRAGAAKAIEGLDRSPLIQGKAKQQLAGVRAALARPGS